MPLHSVVIMDVVVDVQYTHVQQSIVQYIYIYILGYRKIHRRGDERPQMLTIIIKNEMCLVTTGARIVGFEATKIYYCSY